MMKRIIVAVLLSTLLLTGCGSKEPKMLIGDQFIIITDESEYFRHNYKVYDKDTKVIYMLFYNSYDWEVAITPLYNTDGSLQIYEEDKHE